MNCPPDGGEFGLVAYWNFEEGNGNVTFDQTVNGNIGTINGATFDTDVPSQSCQLTTVNGCDSVAVLNLTISQQIHHFCILQRSELRLEQDNCLHESGTYRYDSDLVNNELSLAFSGTGNYISISDNPSIDISDESFSIEVWIKKDTPYNNGTTASVPGSRQPADLQSGAHLLC